MLRTIALDNYNYHPRFQSQEGIFFPIPQRGEACFALIPRLRKITHEERLRIARLISDRVVNKYGSDILAVYVCGSTSKKA
jgi:hypothetical protein